MSVTRLQSAIVKTGSSAMSLLGKGASVAEVQYNALMQRNAQYVVRDAQQEKLLFRQWFYTKLSKLSGIMKAAEMEAKELNAVWAKRGDYTVRDVAYLAMFGVEVFAWFSVGEILGRGGTITGYYF